MDILTKPLALIIGGSGAVGTAVIHALTRRGFAVICTYHRHKPAARENNVSWVRFDAKDCAAVEVMEAIRRDSRPLSVLIYLAGVPSTKRTITDTCVEEFTRLFKINALGLVTIWQAVAKRARESGARVVIVSSDATRSFGAGNGAYTASKAALEALSLTLAKEENCRGVQVNVIAPSLVDSSQAETILAYMGETDPSTFYASLPWGRALTVVEVAEVVASIGADEAWRYATGQIIRLAADIGRPNKEEK